MGCGPYAVWIPGGSASGDYVKKAVEINESAFQKVCADLNRLLGDAVSDPLWALRRFEIRHLSAKLPKDGTLVDIGSGPGFVPRYFHEIGAKVISVDPPGSDALKILMNLGIKGYYALIGVNPLPLADSSVDVVFAGNVIEHLPTSPKSFMAELKRVIK